MPAPRPDVLDFLLTRRSRPARTLARPGPDRAAILQMLTAAARSPDHGKLEPWRFVVIEGAARERLSELVAARGPGLGRSEAEIAKMAAQFTDAPVAIAVISAPKPSEKAPEIEQRLSAGAVCLALLNAALASGWGANWLTGWAVHDPGFARDGLGVGARESVAGLVHIGTETATPPDRPRPDLAALTTWLGE